MLNKYNFLVLFSLCLFAFSSCTKEDIDITTTEEENPTTVVECDGFDVQLFESNGTITAEVIEGTGPYLYEWSTGENTGNISVEESGVYSITVTDAVGCDTSEEIEVEVESGNCDNILSLNANTITPISFSAESEAYLWKSSCAEFNASSTPQYDHNYLVVDITWDAWGTNQDPTYFDISDGVPGITFGSNGVPQIGDVLSPYFIGDDYFYELSTSTNFDLDDIEITITESSDVVGGQVAGVLSGTIVDQNDPDNSSTLSGSFCVTIVNVCD